MYVHNLDPFAIEFPAGFSLGPLHVDGIRWYGLAYLAGFIFGYLTISYVSRRGNSPMKLDQVADFITLVAVGTMLGGRLGYCIFYSPSLLFDFSTSFPFWGVLKVYEGGMASHGGILGIIFVCFYWARKYKMDGFHLLDLCVFGGSLGIFFGRIANFINGELYGRQAPADLSWGVKFPQEMVQWTKDQVARLNDLSPAVEALGQVKTQFGETLNLSAEAWKGWVQNYHADAGSWNSVNLVIDQLIAATQSGNAKVIELLEPVLTPRYPSQLIQALLEGLLVFVILAWIWRKPRRPGVVSAWFGICYAVARIIGEQFRLPDAHIGFQLFGLTRGQWLSLLMLAGAGAYYWYILRRKSHPMGGFRTSM